MLVDLKVLSMRSAGTESEGVGADTVSWIISGDKTWTSMMMRVEGQYWLNPMLVEESLSSFSAGHGWGSRHLMGWLEAPNVQKRGCVAGESWAATTATTDEVRSIQRMTQASMLN